jgi:hypothetical protein
MKNTTTVPAIVAALIAATLVVGGTSAAMTPGHSAFAWKQDSYKNKKGDDSYKNKKGQDSYSKKTRQGYGNGNGNTVTNQIISQNGKQSGHDNSFEQTATNLICTHPDSTCLSEGS